MSLSLVKANRPDRTHVKISSIEVNNPPLSKQLLQDYLHVSLSPSIMMPLVSRIHPHLCPRKRPTYPSNGSDFPFRRDGAPDPRSCISTTPRASLASTQESSSQECAVAYLHLFGPKVGGQGVRGGFDSQAAIRWFARNGKPASLPHLNYITHCTYMYVQVSACSEDGFFYFVVCFVTLSPKQQKLWPLLSNKPFPLPTTSSTFTMPLDGIRSSL